MVHRSHSSPGIVGRSSQKSEILFGNRDYTDFADENSEGRKAGI